MTFSDVPDNATQPANLGNLQKLMFLLVFPLANGLLTLSILLDLGVFTFAALGLVAIRLWVIFPVSLLMLLLVQRYWPKLAPRQSFWRQWLLHVVLVLTVAALFTPIIAPVPNIDSPPSLILPRAMVILEITLYLIVLRLLEQQKHSFAMTLSLQETELNALRAQSNPHFLFNTLNLIVSEIDTDPDNAREIVFDLADLLRKTIALAQQNTITVSQELELVSLYLSLQQKRFSDRLSFDIQLAPEAKNLALPALLLQPVMENTVKYAVAPYATPAHIDIDIGVEQHRLYIQINDTGPAFDDSKIKPGNGFRILHKTLELHYAERYQMQLISTLAGGVFTLSFPAHSGITNPKSSN